MRLYTLKIKKRNWRKKKKNLLRNRHYIRVSELYKCTNTFYNKAAKV